MSNSKLSQVYQVIAQDLEEVLESNFFKEDITCVLKDIKDTWVELCVAYFWRMRITVAHMTLIGGKLGDCSRSSLEKMSSLQSLFSLYKQECIIKYQRSIAKVTDVEIDKIFTTCTQTLLQASRDLTPLEITPNKRLINNKEILQYSEDISVICVFDKSVAKLTLEIGSEFTNKLSSLRDTNPEI
ncbi:6950_t:CDS:2 [Funneliformis caledonium]|uniref:6950_t:CDS:1 n=1 Tax=Funneliformis caledonium TaxID=1117310 RepID=A0A9N9ACZ6_9GLOM|nr:6950_t:CDS:2 [Funneliformis caledonium]